MSTNIISEVAQPIVELQQQNNEIVFQTNFLIGNFVTNNDPRLTDNRDPNPHNFTHSILGSDPLTPQDIGAQPSGDYVLNTDSRLSDSRIPIAHSFSHYIGGSDQITPADIGAQPSGNYITDSDIRLYDARFPTEHATTHSTLGSDPISPSDIGAQPAGNYVLDSDYRLSNDRNPIHHKLTHSIGGNDQILPSDIGAQSLLDPKAIVKGWVNFNGITMSINSSYNISAVTSNGTGDYTITLSSPINLAKYCFVGWSRDWNTDNTVINGLSSKSNSLKSSTSFRVLNNNPINAFNYNSPEISIIIFSPN